MVDSEKLKILIGEFRQLDINDPAASEYWEAFIEELGSENEAIKFLSEANDEDLYILSSVFDDLSLKFQSNKFIEFLKDLQKKHPAADMKLDIEFAEKALTN